MVLARTSASSAVFHHFIHSRDHKDMLWTINQRRDPVSVSVHIDKLPVLTDPVGAGQVKIRSKRLKTGFSLSSAES